MCFCCSKQQIYEWLIYVPQLPSGLTSWEEADEGSNFWQVFASLLKISQHDMNHGQSGLIYLLAAFFLLFIGQYMFEQGFVQTWCELHESTSLQIHRLHDIQQHGTSLKA